MVWLRTQAIGPEILKETCKRDCFPWVQTLISTNINLLEISFGSMLKVFIYIKTDHTGDWGREKESHTLVDAAKPIQLPICVS